MQENTQEKSRIKQNILTYLRYNNISEYRFYKESGITRGILQQPNGISEDNISRFLDYAPNISPTWLLTGKGEMLKGEDFCDDSAIIKTKPVKDDHHVQTFPLHGIPVINGTFEDFAETRKIPGAIPLVSERAIGGFANSDFSIAERDVIAYYVIPKFRHLSVDFMIELIGDSMIPKFYPGDIIACSIITSPSYIQWNKCHLIASREQGLIVKRLMPSKDNGCLKAVSDNKAYLPFDIPKDDICGLALIVGSIHLE